ncbi:hypothetical protein K438DRAFT_1766289 [Mycena galopus ATCC 62051]|nr:hypothetical protein K438DRAFT_1766289 [Mycena galopus ATCC 62051]
MSNLPIYASSRPLLIHTDLPLRPLKRDRTPALSRSLRFDPIARATSTPLSSAAPSFVDGPETPRATPAPAEVAGSATTIPRPTGAQLAVKSCDCIPRKDCNLLKARVKTLVSEMLNIAVPYMQQLPGNLEKIETKLTQEFLFLRQYEKQWPLQVLITARLKHFASQKVTKAAKKIIEAAEAATATSH